MSGYDYPRGYISTPLVEQLVEIANLFNLDLTEAAGRAASPGRLPEGAEGWFAIPRWQKIAPTYGGAVAVALDKIKSASNVPCVYDKALLDPEYLRQCLKAEEAFQELGRKQRGDILIVAAQLGRLHRGSVHRACSEMIDGEFGLGIFAVATILLTNPGRLICYDDLWLDCAGDRFLCRDDGSFEFVPILAYSCRIPTIALLSRYEGNDGTFSGSVSGFLA